MALITSSVAISGIVLATFGKSVLFSKAELLTDSMVDRIKRRISRARESGRLPDNHYIDRGTARAHLKATQICLVTLLEDHTRKIELYDQSQDSHQHRQTSRKPDICCSGLLRQLQKLLNHLEYIPDSATRFRHEKTMLRALDEAALVLADKGSKTTDQASTTKLNKFGAKILHKLNPTRSSMAFKESNYSSIRKTRTRTLPGLENAVLEKVLFWGGWDSSRQSDIKAVLKEIFFSDDELWVQSFALCYAEEIRIDKELNVMATLLKFENIDENLTEILQNDASIESNISEMQDKIADNFSSLSKQIESLNTQAELIYTQAKQVLDDLTSTLRINNKLVFRKPVFESTALTQNEFRPFYFGQEEDGFIGRESLLDELHAKFLRSPSTSDDADFKNFSWVAICGSAGAGKSRLALQLLNIYSGLWRTSGFVRETFLEDPSKLISSAGAIQSPALFIIDYGGRSPEKCVSFIQQCAALAQASIFPIRVVVLIRRPNDPFFDHVSKTRHGSGVRSNQIVLSQDHETENNKSGAIILSGLDEFSTVILMRDRIALTAKILGAEAPDLPKGKAGNEILLKLLRKYDKSGRPLVALIVAYMFVVQKDQLSETSTNDQEEMLLSLLWNYLKLQYRQRWSQSISGTHLDLETSKNRLDCHLNFLLLSTISRGLTNTEWDDLLANDKFDAAVERLLPSKPENLLCPADQRYDKHGLMASLSGHINDEDSPFPIFEPDLLGESLILLALSSHGREICESNDTHLLRQKYLLDLAGVASPGGVKFFSMLTAQDFPATSAKHNWLLSSIFTANDKITLFRNLVPATIEPFWSRAAEQSDLNYIEHLIDNFKPEENASDEVKLSYAEGVLDLTKWLSFIINKSSAPKSNASFKPIRDKADQPSFSSKSAFDSAEEQSSEDGHKTIGLISVSTDEDDRNHEEIFHLFSDEVTIKDVSELLLKLFKVAESHVSNKRETFAVRSVWASVTGYVLQSLLWRHRNNPEKFGYALNPLSEKEIEIRNSFSNLYEKKLANTNLDEDTVAIASSMINMIIYSEHQEDGTGVPKARSLLHHISRLHSTNGFTKLETTHDALRFLGNCSYILMSHLVHDPEKNAGKIFVAVSDIYDISIKLFQDALRLMEASPSPSNLEVISPKILSCWCDIGSRLMQCTNKNSKIYFEILHSFDDGFRKLISNSDKALIDNKVINFLSYYLEVYSRNEYSSRDSLQLYESLAINGEFDAISLNSPSWKNLTHHFTRLLRLGGEDQLSVKIILESALKQIGPRAARDLAQAAIFEMPGPAVQYDLTHWMINWIIDEEDISLEVFSNSILAFASQKLYLNQEKSVFEDMDKLWDAGDRERDFYKKSISLLVYKQVILWRGLNSKNDQKWRGRVIDQIVSSEDYLSNLHDQREKLFEATKSVAEVLVQLEVEAGNSIEEWMSIGERT